MNKLTALFALAVSCLLTVGCAVDAEPSQREVIIEEAVISGVYSSSDDAHLWEDLAVLSIESKSGVSYVTDEAGEYSIIPSESELCECRTAECEQAWFIDNIGCGFCAVVRCGDETEGFTNHGGCLPCGDTTESNQAAAN